MVEGAEFPPLIVFFDGATYWLADGFHRYYGAQRSRTEFPAMFGKVACETLSCLVSGQTRLTTIGARMKTSAEPRSS